MMIWSALYGNIQQPERAGLEVAIRPEQLVKRAGFKWGIGRELYTSPKIRFRVSDIKVNDSGKCYDSFVVTDIAYDDSESICWLVVLDETTGKEFRWGNSGSSNSDARPAPTPEVPEVISSAERKMLFDLGKKIHGDKVGDVVKEICTKRGISASKDIPKSVYAEILEEVKNFKIA